MWSLLGVSGVGTLLLCASALRNPASFRMGARNIPRRKAQTALIVLGLMLATLLFSASFTTGETLTNSLRAQALENIGQVDVVLEAERPDTSDQQIMTAATERSKYFEEDLADRARDRLSENNRVEGVAPLAVEMVPVISERTDLSEPVVDVLGIEEGSMQGFDRLTSGPGETLSIGDLDKSEVYVSAGTAEGLDIGIGDEIRTMLGRPSKSTGVSSGAPPIVPSIEFTVAGIYEKGANPASGTSMVMPLDRLQRLFGLEGKINSILVSHEGPVVEGAVGTSATIDDLRPLLRKNELRANALKQDALDQADENGEQFTNVFLLFGQFSVAAGILLILMIFVMLAAERKHELGLARAVGMGRGHLMRMFIFEGALYALMASAVGSVLGVGVGWMMVRVLGEAFAGQGFEIRFATSPENIVVAFCLGMVLTFTVVLLASWRVSRLNVVRALRDIPEPEHRGRNVKSVLLAILVPTVGSVLFLQGLVTEQMGLYMLGLSLLIVGTALLARILRLADRIAFTAAGLGLLTIWLSPFELASEGRFAEGIDLFFISGIMIVLGGVWIVIYNCDLILGVIVGLFGWIRGMPPILRAAVSYPLQSRLRTGMTLAMFSLVVFTIVTMSFIVAAFASISEDAKHISGGFDVRADVGYLASIYDMEEALKNAKEVNESDVTAVGSVSGLSVQAKQLGTDRKPKELYVQGVDENYSEYVTYGFNTTVAEYNSAREVWRALQEEQDTVVVSANLAPARSSFSIGEQQPPIELSGFYQEDEALPNDLYIRVEDPRSGETRDLQVIGVLEDAAYFAGSVMTSRKTVNGIANGPVPARSYQFRLKKGAGAAATANDLEKGFSESGLQAAVVEEEILDSAATNLMVNNLLMGFMGLGLLVGIAALGVITARSVVERRQQIGMLRALGYQRGQVRLAFLIESSFVALLGIGLGVVLGAALSGGVIDALSKDIAGIRYVVPWATLGVIVFLAYVASLLTTYLPARQASRIYPAEALRYE